MSLERINIGKEIYINFIESDKFKTNFVNIDIISRLENDLKASKNALLAKVLMRGSKNYPTLAELNKRCYDLYAASVGCWVNKFGEAQVTMLSATMLENKYALDDTNIADETIDLLGDIFTNPLTDENSGFKSDYVETEKTNLINDILAQINNKGAYVYQKCIETMCRDERFSINNPGTVETVRMIDGKSLYDHYNYVLANCAIEIYCVGRFREKKEAITEKFKNLLKDIKREKIENCDSDIILNAEFNGETIEEMEVNQGKLAMGFRIGTYNKNPDFINYILFDTIYASTPTGKLFQNVREKLSLCYYCSTTAEPQKGIMTVLCGIEVDHKQQAIDEILKQLDEMKNGNFTDKDIEVAKLVIVNSYKGIFDNAGSIVNWYRRRLMAGKIETPEEMIEKTNKLTRENIIEAANKITLDTIYFLKGTNLNNGDHDTDDDEI